MSDTQDNFPELTLMFAGFQALNTPQADRAEALLIVASNLKVMRPEPRHVQAMVDFMGDAA